MNSVYFLGWFLFRLMYATYFRWRVFGADNVPSAGGVILASNHASFLDPPLVGIAFDEMVYSFARKTLFNHPLAAKILRSWQVLAVDRDKPDAASLKNIIRLLRDGNKVIMFPEGTRSYDGVPQSAEAGVGLFIAKSKAPVLPVRLFGTYEAYPRGAKSLRPAKITLVVGDLWQPDLKRYAESSKELYQILADEVMHRITELRV